MADIDSTPSGTFCWPELATTDQSAATAYYAALFGWKVDNQPMGPGETYTLFKVRDRDAAAGYTMRKDEQAMGMPPHWNSYISVSSADDAAKKVTELGGKVVAPPFDVMEAGRMAVCQDPTGAYFCLWQPKKSIGVRVRNEPGSLCWTELSTRDTKAAQAFYTGLLGWTAKPSPPGSPMEYTEFSVGGQPSIGMMPMPDMVPPEVPSFWLPYFQVTSVDDTASKSKALGGDVRVPPSDIPNTGRFAVLTDPQGATFAVYTPAHS